MNLSVGIVGLPNVGKSTLFNALLKKQQALAANYPFATIEPNLGIVAVPDFRLQKLAEITKEEEKMTDLPPIKPATIEFVDIAGLVKGAAEGAGLGNKFLSHIREVSVVAHVVRAFEDPDVIKEGAVDPKSDYEVIRAELIIADLQTVEKQRESKTVKIDPVKKSAVEKLYQGLNEGKSASGITLTEEEQVFAKELFLLSNKPEVIVLNVSEEQYNPTDMEKIINQYAGLLEVSNEKVVVICAKIESELASLTDDEQKEYLKDLGLEASGLERLIQKAYATLGLISFLTAGEKEVRAWTIRKGINAQQAAGEIHTDFIKKFIKAEVVGFSDFEENNGWKGSREKGKAGLQGKEYLMQDGDIVEFKIGA
ncbi:MAG TPA: redox-regulated ATPase YchF [Patescibacteria group bacterium]|nr:redox-regulated ATPase YchF [Patescibacteria group bacterium]